MEDPVIFERVDINEGNSWNSSLNTANISQAGWYYLHLDVATCSGSNIKLEININDKPVFAAQFMAITNHASQSKGQSVILVLSTDDKLKVSPSRSEKKDLFIWKKLYGILWHAAHSKVTFFILADHKPVCI